MGAHRQRRGANPPGSPRAHNGSSRSHRHSRLDPIVGIATVAVATLGLATAVISLHTAVIAARAARSNEHTAHIQLEIARADARVAHIDEAIANHQLPRQAHRGVACPHPLEHLKAQPLGLLPWPPLSCCLALHPSCDVTAAGRSAPSPGSTRRTYVGARLSPTLPVRVFSDGTAEHSGAPRSSGDNEERDSRRTAKPLR
jgi:hypothetical protein